MYEADFHKAGIYGSGLVWANSWDAFRCAPSRDGSDRWAAVDFVVCFGWGNFFLLWFSFVYFFFHRTRLATSMSPPCLTYLSNSVLRYWDGYGLCLLISSGGNYGLTRRQQQQCAQKAVATGVSRQAAKHSCSKEAYKIERSLEVPATLVFVLARLQVVCVCTTEHTSAEDRLVVC